MKKCILIVCFVSMLSGCMGNSQPSIAVKQYTLEYPSLRFENLSMIDQIIRVERFTAAQAFHNNDMIYRQKQFMRGVYNYNRWNISPSDMLTELLLRDIRNVHVFGAVLSRQDNGDARFLLEGQIEEFMEIDEEEHTGASLIVDVTLTDLFVKIPAKRIILQKTYKFMEPFKERQPPEFAGAMSKAVEKFSKELISDINGIAKGMKETNISP